VSLNTYQQKKKKKKRKVIGKNWYGLTVLVNLLKVQVNQEVLDPSNSN